jgi:hypothetical protein
MIDKFKKIEHISITCDIWSSLSVGTSFLGVTAHFIEENCFGNIILK